MGTDLTEIRVRFWEHLVSVSCYAYLLTLIAFFRQQNSVFFLLFFFVKKEKKKICFLRICMDGKKEKEVKKEDR